MNSAQQSHAITVIGHDRPGIIAETAARLADLGLNIEDTTMTKLSGHFAMMLLCSGAKSDAEISDRLAPLAADGTLAITVRAVVDEPDVAIASTPWVLSVHGGDRPGIVASVVAEVASVGGNITDLTTRLAGDLYVLIAEVELPATADPDVLRSAILGQAQRLKVTASLRPAETDDL